ncbi:DUF3341 domain-containing protein [Blattabacterium cuenoti]|uniref:DUF3341 domain-containing protein n=1 Tax=Blattabacterium cuenoti TaxID=1653831 RepID=UPI00163CA711|nr:DUF3341 domain-containing protein [Blattabacterium cuenoti]
MNKCTVHALYDNDHTLINSLKYIKEHNKKNCNIHEVYSPFPIHGLEKILNLEKTNLSFLSFIYGTFGFCISCLLTWYIMIFDWPQNIGGKPSFSWINNLPSFIPVIFELTIFFSAHLMCITYLIQGRLFPGCMAKNLDPRTTDNLFLIEIRTTIENVEDVMNFLKKNGAIEVKSKHI